jgi:hypothetical protein
LTGSVERSLVVFYPVRNAECKHFGTATDDEVFKMAKTREMPCMPDWHGEASDDGFVARRVVGLSDYQMLNGCLHEVLAEDEGELWLLCDAQTRLSERVALAESTRGRA